VETAVSDDSEGKENAQLSAVAKKGQRTARKQAETEKEVLEALTALKPFGAEPASREKAPNPILEGQTTTSRYSLRTRILVSTN
jgi:hypothetical protein